VSVQCYANDTQLYKPFKCNKHGLPITFCIWMMIKHKLFCSGQTRKPIWALLIWLLSSHIALLRPRIWVLCFRLMDCQSRTFNFNWSKLDHITLLSYACCTGSRSIQNSAVCVQSFKHSCSSIPPRVDYCTQSSQITHRLGIC